MMAVHDLARRDEGGLDSTATCLLTVFGKAALVASNS